MKYLFCILLTLFCMKSLYGQQKDDQQAFDILNTAMGNIGNEDNNTSMYFEGIAFGIQNPLTVFTLPAYKVHRGGFMLTEGKKFEIQLGIMKALCDGKIMVIIDEQSKSMVIDSVRDHVPGLEDQTPDIQKMLEENIGVGNLKYEGKETVNGKLCHKIKASYSDELKTHVYYWVEVTKNQLLLMAEWQTNAYDVYWIRKMGKCPKGHVFAVNIPKREIETLYGYEVFDMRFTSAQLQSKPQD
ncbi:MAG: hypothetical protein ACJ75J_13170 [Cytophagaceae bacterium]